MTRPEIMSSLYTASRIYASVLMLSLSWIGCAGGVVDLQGLETSPPQGFTATPTSGTEPISPTEASSPGAATTAPGEIPSGTPSPTATNPADGEDQSATPPTAVSPSPEPTASPTEAPTPESGATATPAEATPPAPVPTATPVEPPPLEPTPTAIPDLDGDGFSPAQGDCNDLNPAIGPGAAEQCDGQDNNCNGEADEGVLYTFYRDSDGDKYGSVNSFIRTCGSFCPSGYTGAGSDCNDGNASVHPGAKELLGDGLDSDCDGSQDLIVTVAGNGTPGYSGDAGQAVRASLAWPVTACMDKSGNLLIADAGNHRVRKVATSGIISTIVGNGTPSSTGDGGPATSATVNAPYGLVCDPLGNLFVGENLGHRIRKIDTNGTIITYAGTGVAGYSGDDGPAVNAQLFGPNGMVLDGTGNLLISDFANHRIRKVTPAGEISTVAGNGKASFSGDGASAAGAGLNGPSGVALDSLGNLYIADARNNRIRRVDTRGIISSVAGNGAATSTGDGGLAVQAGLNAPGSVLVDRAGNLLVSEFDGQRVRRISTAGLISTLAGNGSSSSTGDDGMASQATVNNVYEMSLDAAGNLYLAEYGGHVVRRISP